MSSLSESDQPVLVLLSGMAADASVFAPQAVAFPGLIVPDWIEPRWNEGLAEYCRRLAPTIDASDNPVLGGASFGGLVAQQLAAHLRPRSVVLIGSLRSPDELPRWMRALRPVAPLTWLLPVGLVQAALRPLTWRWAKRRAPHLAGVARQFCQANPKLLKWSVRELLLWRGAPQIDCPVYRVHGDCDRVLPLRQGKPDRLIDGGGHVISLTHASAVNEVLRAACQAE